MENVFASLNSDQVNKIFPFYLIIDKNLVIKSYGNVYLKLTGRLDDQLFTDFFTILRPKLNVINFDNLLSYKDSLIIFEIKNHPLKLRGQFIRPESSEELIFFGSVWMNSIKEFEQSNLILTDFALHDSLVEMLHILNSQEIVTEDIKSLVYRMGQQKDQLESRETKYRDLVDNLYDAVLSFDENSNILECNKALSNITGYTEEELLKMSGKDITYEEDWAIAHQSTNELQEKGFISNFQLRCITKTGQIKDIEISSNAIFENGVYKGSRDIVRDISDRKKIEERLRDLSMVTEETSNIIIIAGSDRKIEWVNKGFTNITGFTLEEVVGESPGNFLQGINTDQETKKEISEALFKGKSFKGTILNYSKNGIPYWNDLSINPIKGTDGNIVKYISVASDVTELVKKSEELLNSELRWKFALEGSGDGVFEFNTAQNKFYGTDSLKSLLGFEMEIPELDFEDLISIIHPDDKKNAVSSFVKLLHGEISTFRHELRLRKNNGIYVWLLIRATITKFDANGLPLIILGTTTDITHIKETEKELIAAKTIAESASEYKNQFLATMSHEIRTPLNAIIGLSNLMLMEKPTGEIRENLTTLSFSANHLLSLINDILDLSKIEAGKIEFMNSDFDLAALMQGVYNTFLQKCNEKYIDIELNVDKTIPKVLIGDSLRLVQILNNLVNNAVKFTDKGSIKIKVSPIAFDNKKIKLLFEVIDTGIGINQNQQINIFDDFVQADATIVQKYGGTGLGLTIIKNLIELQNGNIKVESQLGVGSRFYFDLCFQISKSKITKLAKQEIFENNNLTLDGIKVLLVEDIAVNQKVAVAYLNHWKAKTICASNGKEAIQIFSKNDFDILLIDIYMPIMNGFEAIKKIRKSKKGASIPIIALTASADTNTLQKAIDCGATLCLSKPFVAKQLFETIFKLTTKLSDSEKFHYTPSKDNNTSSKSKSKQKQIDLTIIEEASLGDPVFITDMIELLKKEIPNVLTECQLNLDKRDYEGFSLSIHKLKNSLILLGMTGLKNTLVKLENDSKSGINLNELDNNFSEILKTWKKAKVELDNLETE